MTDRAQNQHFVQFPPATIQSLLAAVGKGLEAAETANELRHLGVDCGGALHDHLRRHVGGTDPHGAEPADLSADTFWAGLTHFFEELGWGRLEQLPLHDGFLSLSSADWFEAEDRREDHPCCHFSTGVLAELFRRVADNDLAVMEADCRAAGGERCEFLVGSPAALDAVYQEMTSGGTFRDAIAQLG
jgi:hypothetical protein